MKKPIRVKYTYFISMSLLISLIALIFTGCGSAPLKDFTGLNKPSSGNALVIIYRPKYFYGGGVPFTVGIESPNTPDGNFPKLSNGGLVQHELPEGQYSLGYDGFPARVEKFLKAGGTYCLETSMNGIVAYIKEVPLSACKGIAKGEKMSRYNPN